MIAQLTGLPTFKGDRFIIMEVSGVGYQVFVLNDLLNRISLDEPENLKIWTYLAVREDALDLFGFESRLELEYFQMLIGISGVGPKSALGILSIAPPETLDKAISAEDVGYLTKVSGIGRKTAEKIVLELKDKISNLDRPESSEKLSAEADALDALQALGYSLRESREALKQLPPTATDTASRIKAALQILGK